MRRGLMGSRFIIFKPFFWNALNDGFLMMNGIIEGIFERERHPPYCQIRFKCDTYYSTILLNVNRVNRHGEPHAQINSYKPLLIMIAIIEEE